MLEDKKSDEKKRERLLSPRANGPSSPSRPAERRHARDDGSKSGLQSATGIKVPKKLDSRALSGLGGVPAQWQDKQLSRLSSHETGKKASDPEKQVSMNSKSYAAGSTKDVYQSSSRAEAGDVSIGIQLGQSANVRQSSATQRSTLTAFSHRKNVNASI